MLLKSWKKSSLSARRDISNGRTCEVSYHLIGFGDMSGKYTPKDFERVYDSLREYNTDISHEIYKIYEGTTIDK